MADDTSLNEQLRQAQIEIGAYEVKLKALKSECQSFREKNEELTLEQQQLELNYERSLGEWKSQLVISEQNGLAQTKKCAELTDELREQKAKMFALEERLSALDHERVQWIHNSEHHAQQAKVSAKQNEDQLALSLAGFENEKKIQDGLVQKLQQSNAEYLSKIQHMEGLIAKHSETALLLDKQHREALERNAFTFQKEQDELRAKLQSLQNNGFEQQAQWNDNISALKKVIRLCFFLL